MDKSRGRRIGILTCAMAFGAMASMASADAPLADTEAVDAAVRPGEDFYAYANNVWLRATQLPDGASRIDTTAQLRTANAERVRGLIAETVAAAGNAPKAVAPTDRKIADYYLTLTDAAAIEAKGLTPIAGDLAAIAAITDRPALVRALGASTQLDDGNNAQTRSLFGVWIHQGFHDPRRHAAHLVQGGLGLDDRESYLAADAEAVAARSAYRARIANALKLAGFDRAEERAAAVLDLETAIARTHASRADTSDVFKTDNDWRLADFRGKAPGIDWDAYFAAAGLDAAANFVVWQPGAVIGSARLVATQPLDAWKDYLAFRLIDRYGTVLPRAFGGAAPEALSATQAVFGDAIGRLYAARYFAPPAKAAAEAMVANIRTAFRARLAAAAWMSPAMKSKALAKLAALRIGVGYPEVWTDYSALAVRRGDAFGNYQRAERFAYRREVAKLGRPVDPGEWYGKLHPQMVGAILNLSPNSMQFAAGLFQPPYFDPGGDAAANYGSAGAGLAHEVSHSFDEVGNIYDAQGRLGLWWTKDEPANYRAAVSPLARQLDGCAAAPGLHARGDKVLGESVADLRGLLVALDAYHLSLRGRPDIVKNGLTGDQRFFVAFAQRWRRLQTDASLRTQVETDNHAPPSCRSGLVQNSEAWMRAFDIQPGQKMFVPPDARVAVW